MQSWTQRSSSYHRYTFCTDYYCLHTGVLEFFKKGKIKTKYLVSKVWRSSRKEAKDIPQLRVSQKTKEMLNFKYSNTYIYLDIFNRIFVIFSSLFTFYCILWMYFLYYNLFFEIIRWVYITRFHSIKSNTLPIYSLK